MSSEGVLEKLETGGVAICDFTDGWDDVFKSSYTSAEVVCTNFLKLKLYLLFVWVSNSGEATRLQVRLVSLAPVPTWMLDVSKPDREEEVQPTAACLWTMFASSNERSKRVEHHKCRPRGHPPFPLWVIKHHQVKDTDYSLISLMFQIARKDTMVMDMVIAIGLQEINSRRNIPQFIEKQDSLVYYSSALRQLVDGILPNVGIKSLNVLYTTLWMMLYYEQQFGDPLCVAYTQHLEGISSLLRNQHARMQTTNARKDLPDDAEVYQGEVMTVYSARVLVWISSLDAAAASSGIGGQVITAILDTLIPCGSWSEGCSADTVKAVTKFH
ncbi:hypothetical protein T440DRAFT_483095 [Plenodomus tracheiphilus IPT5]|uniref:Transcription factor domain-containing protein n=1 Tax=Plenodomus tracheiphilus IPT5 TaxID=1408161 RepID=A0A6A7AR59_9PLEO|nr:hypothetical protein T440DRAFT_483095 [Plenodomus tracheiphilus IPT5]